MDIKDNQNLENEFQEKKTKQNNMITKADTKKKRSKKKTNKKNKNSPANPPSKDNKKNEHRGRVTERNEIFNNDSQTLKTFEIFYLFIFNKNNFQIIE